MIIHYLSSSEIPSRAANSVHVMKLCQALAQTGNDLVLYAKNAHPAAENDVDVFRHYDIDPCFEIIRCKRPRVRKLVGDLIYARTVSREVKQRPLPDLFYGRHPFSLVAVASLGVPFIHHAHKPPGNRLERALESRLYRHPGFVRLVVITDALRRIYQRHYPWLPDDKLVVAPNGADLSNRSNEIDLGINWPGRADCLQVGYVGNLYPGRGIHIITSLVSRLPNMDFHVIGGMERDLRERKNLCSGRNLFFHGFVPHRELIWYLRRLDVVLAPYQTRVLGVGRKRDNSPWMSPIKIFEYMAAEKAIVCSDLPVLREVLRHRVNALLVNPEDVDSWADALVELQQDATLRESLARTAWHDFIGHHTWRHRAHTVLARGRKQDSVLPLTPYSPVQPVPEAMEVSTPSGLAD